MKADIAYVQEKFREFNRRMFDGKLPELPISVTNAKSYLGVCLYRNRFKWNGKREYYDFKLRISRRIDLSQDELDDTIIHEMIHYWIGLFSPISDLAAISACHIVSALSNWSRQSIIGPRNT